MAIVSTEVESIQGDVNRSIYYRCLDSDGMWHNYGPVLSNDPGFDADAHKTVVAAKLAEMLANREAEGIIG